VTGGIALLADASLAVFAGGSWEQVALDALGVVPGFGGWRLAARAAGLAKAASSAFRVGADLIDAAGHCAGPITRMALTEAVIASKSATRIRALGMVFDAQSAMSSVGASVYAVQH
jgi:hypothetical protein